MRLPFQKWGRQGVTLESRRGAGGDFEQLAIDTESPYLDERPLLVATAPEVREYHARYWDKGTPNGDWTDVRMGRKCGRPGDGAIEPDRGTRDRCTGSAMYRTQERRHVVAWGANLSSPFTVPSAGLSQVNAIAAGNEYALALVSPNFNPNDQRQ